MKLRLAGDPKTHEIEIISRDDAHICARIDGEEIEARIDAAATGAILRIGDRSIRLFAARQRDTILVALGPAQFEFAPVESTARRRSSGSMAQTIAAPMPGKVLKILVEERQQVEAGAPLLVLEAMKMETTLYAEAPAFVAKIRAAVGAMVDHGTTLIELSPLPPTPTST
jgi:acetyl/propionyl-CoA carboxylase alpha subunit